MQRRAARGGVFHGRTDHRAIGRSHHGGTDQAKGKFCAAFTYEKATTGGIEEKRHIGAGLSNLSDKRVRSRIVAPLIIGNGRKQGRGIDDRIQGQCAAGVFKENTRPLKRA